MLEVLGAVIEEVVESQRDRAVLDAGEKAALDLL